MNRPQVVSAAEWQAARERLLIEEKEATRVLDALAAERRRLPMVEFMAANDPIRVVAPPRRVRRLDRGRGMNERDGYRWVSRSQGR